jgi:hypothetical protein
VGHLERPPGLRRPTRQNSMEPPSVLVLRTPLSHTLTTLSTSIHSPTPPLHPSTCPPYLLPKITHIYRNSILA